MCRLPVPIGPPERFPSYPEGVSAMSPRAHCRARQESAVGPFLAAPISICYDMLVKQAERMIR